MRGSMDPLSIEQVLAEEVVALGRERFSNMASTKLSKAGPRTANESAFARTQTLAAALARTRARSSETYEVRADSELLSCEQAECLPMTQRYSLF